MAASKNAVAPADDCEAGLNEASCPAPEGNAWLPESSAEGIKGVTRPPDGHRAPGATKLGRCGGLISNPGLLTCPAPLNTVPFLRGPWHPLQIGFVVLVFLAFIFFIVEVARGDGTDFVRVVTALGFLLLSVCLVWLGDSAYLLKAKTQECAALQGVTSSLHKQVDDLASQHSKCKDKNAELEKGNLQLRQQIESYADKNCEHKRLNGEMQELNTSLTTQVRDLLSEGEVYKEQNAKHQLQIAALTDKVEDLGCVEKQLGVLANECNGSVVQARSVLERLERDLRLNTANTAFLFFDRIDRKKSGKLANKEVSLFVDNLSFLWRHLPTFNKEKLKVKLTAQGGISLEQVSELVDEMLVEEDTYNRDHLAKQLRRSSRSDNLATPTAKHARDQPKIDEGNHESICSFDTTDELVLDS